MDKNYMDKEVSMATTKMHSDDPLTEAEVNVYGKCTSMLKRHCEHDCIFFNALISSSQ